MDCLGMIFDKKAVFIHIIIFSFVIVNVSFAGRLLTVDGVTAYHTDEGEVAKNTWVWVDDNGDSIAECYRFDKDGHLAINYKDRYGKETNNEGQLIENGEVIKKMLSNGEILNKKMTPA